jgi:glycosyltransferase involved in cell wall biosynthesis
MRLLYFTEADSPHDQRFLKALAGTNHQVYALRQKESQLKTPRGIIELGWPDGQPDWCCWDGWKKGCEQLKVITQKLQPDLIHAGPIQGPALLTALTGYRPLVTMSWGSDILVRARRSPWMGFATKYVLDRTRIFLADCQTVADEAKTYGFPEKAIVQFPWGVDLDFFSPDNGRSQGHDLRTSLGWEDYFVILCNRSWHPIYGVDVLAEAFVQSLSENDRLRLLLVGDGPQSDRIHGILQPVDDKVHYLGQVETEELPGVYCAADLFISPSHSDGSSISLLEAMACGRPVLVSDIPSNQEWVKPGETGDLFSDGKPQSLAGKILELANDKNLEEYGRRARALAEKRANWDENFQKLLLAYQMAL